MANIQAYRLVERLQNDGLDVLLTGGLAIEGWSGKEFKTNDWDIVGGLNVEPDDVIERLRELGYEKRGKVWVKIDPSGDIPPQNPGQFLTVQYPWGKTHKLVIVDRDIEVETVAPEWLLVNRMKKVKQGLQDYAEQAYFLDRQFRNNPNYNWNEELVETIADNQGLKSSICSTKQIEKQVGLSH